MSKCKLIASRHLHMQRSAQVKLIFRIHVVNEQHMMTNTVHCDMKFPPVAGGSEPSEDHEDCRCALEGPKSSKLLELPDDPTSALT
jgi:hypothetical protein